MKRLVTILVLAALAFALLATGAAAGPAQARSAEPAAIATFSPGDYGSFAEGMAADSHGNLWVSLTVWGLYDDSVDPPDMTSNTGQIWKVAPSGACHAQGRRDLTPYGMLLGRRREGRPRLRRPVRSRRGGLLDRRLSADAGGKLTQVVKLPGGRLAERHRLPRPPPLHDRQRPRRHLACPVGRRHGMPTKPWLEDALLAPGDPNADPPMTGIGANGIALPPRPSVRQRRRPRPRRAHPGAQRRLTRQAAGGLRDRRSSRPPTASPSTPSAACGSPPTPARPAKPERRRSTG